jgi:hypothetical protein
MVLEFKLLELLLVDKQALLIMQLQKIGMEVFGHQEEI